jgi:putative component of toxin-antitoxin plasmid stabilization module
MGLDRLAARNPADVRPVGGDVSELRIKYGPDHWDYHLQMRALIVLFP